MLVLLSAHFALTTALTHASAPVVNHACSRESRRKIDSETRWQGWCRAETTTAHYHPSGDTPDDYSQPQAPDRPGRRRRQRVGHPGDGAVGQAAGRACTERSGTGPAG